MQNNNYLKNCEDCDRSFMSEDPNDKLCYLCKDNVQDFKEALAEDEGVKEYIEKKQQEREDWMIRTINKELSLFERVLFYFYRKLADRFAGSDKKGVRAVQKREGLNSTRFGVFVKGKTYWMEEKETYGL